MMAPEEHDHERAVAFGLRMTVENLRVIKGWAWSVEDASGFLAGGVEATKGSANGEAARASLMLTDLASIQERQD